MGTVVSFDLRPGRRTEEQVAQALAAACAELHRADATFSTYRPDSPLTRLRRGEVSLGECPPEVAEVLARCDEARVASGGWFDAWALPGGVDPTGLVKGWAAERALAALTAAGVQAAMVNAAGDVVVAGEPEPGRSWHVGVRDPRDPAGVCCVVPAAAPLRAVATSGRYERGDHVLDPRTGQPARAVLAATVVGPDLTLADALATGLLAAGLVGLRDLAALDGWHGLVVGEDGRVLTTPGFPQLAV